MIWLPTAPSSLLNDTAEYAVVRNMLLYPGLPSPPVGARLSAGCWARCSCARSVQPFHCADRAADIGLVLAPYGGIWSIPIMNILETFVRVLLPRAPGTGIVPWEYCSRTRSSSGTDGYPCFARFFAERVIRHLVPPPFCRTVDDTISWG